MTDGDKNLAAAQQALEGAEEAGGEMVPEGDEQAATGETDAPENVWDRLWRTDKPINLDDNTDVWDPEGKGGANRFGAAAKQAFGVDEWPPILHMGIAGAEGFYLFVTDALSFDAPEEDENAEP